MLMTATRGRSAAGRLALAAFCGLSLGHIGATAAESGGAPAGSEQEVPRLRCWQEGRLIFEKVGWKTLSVRAVDKATLVSEGVRGLKLVLIDVGRATCLLEED